MAGQHHYPPELVRWSRCWKRKTVGSPAAVCGLSAASSGSLHKESVGELWDCVCLYPAGRETTAPLFPSVPGGVCVCMPEDRAEIPSPSAPSPKAALPWDTAVHPCPRDLPTPQSPRLVVKLQPLMELFCSVCNEIGFQSSVQSLVTFFN